jgi:hypothetical protein
MVGRGLAARAQKFARDARTRGSFAFRKAHGLLRLL